MLNPKEVGINESILHISFFSILFVSPLPLGHEFQLIFECAWLILPLDQCKGLQTEQLWLSPWKQYVLTLKHLIHSGDYHLLKQWRGFRWSWRNGMEKFRWSRFSKCINRLCVSFCILTCLSKKTNCVRPSDAPSRCWSESPKKWQLSFTMKFSGRKL